MDFDWNQRETSHSQRPFAFSFCITVQIPLYCYNHVVCAGASDVEERTATVHQVAKVVRIVQSSRPQVALIPGFVSAGFRASSLEYGGSYRRDCVGTALCHRHPHSSMLFIRSFVHSPQINKEAHARRWYKGNKCLSLHVTLQDCTHLIPFMIILSSSMLFSNFFRARTCARK